MAERKRFAGPGDYSINVATERMKDGRWSGVTTVKQTTATGERNIDLPVAEVRFTTEAEAQSFEVTRALEWIEQNAPAGELG
jgi:hypothetical protein